MDLWRWLTSQIGEFIVGVVLLLIGYGYFKLGFSVKTLKLLRIVGVILVGVAVLSYLGINLFATEEAPPSETVGAFEVTASESMSHLTVDNNANVVTWAVDYNYTTEAFDSSSNYASILFSVDRGLGTVGLVQTYGDVTSIPSISNDTTGQSYPILTKTNDQYNALWNRSDGTSAYKMVTITIAETADGAQVTLNLTLNGDALDAMDVYDSVNIGLSIGGQSWTIQVLEATVP
jgi:hypothetical protein